MGRRREEGTGAKEECTERRKWQEGKWLRETGEKWLEPRAVLSQDGDAAFTGVTRFFPHTCFALCVHPCCGSATHSVSDEASES